MKLKQDKLSWCKKQTKGIKLIDPKIHLSESYMKEADETLENVFVTKGKWKVITAYYACYNAFYSILMKCGIKSEIHDCTIELMPLFDFEDFDVEFLKRLKYERIQVQYYLKTIELNDEFFVKEFIFKCKQILDNLDSTTIENIRTKLENNGC